MESKLDDMDIINQLDKEGMLNAIGGFPEYSRNAIENCEKINLGSIVEKKYNGLLIAGMGGSAVGGLMLKSWIQPTCNIPIEVNRGYHLPGWVDENTLVFVVSYSGNTAETYSQYREAIERGCTIICFCSGGKLSQNASRRKLPIVKFPKGFQPRVAISFQFFSLITIAKKIGVINEEWIEVSEALEVISKLSEELRVKSPLNENLSKQLASNLMDYVPYVYGNRLFEVVAYRYKTQLNENSKTPASASFFPEAFHNSIMTREANNKMLEKICIVILSDPEEEKSLAEKIKRFSDLMSEKAGRVVEVEAVGKSRLSRMLSALYIGDFASAYLGILYGHDPSSTDSINTLKSNS